MRLFLALLFGTTLLFAAPVPKDKKKTDEDPQALVRLCCCRARRAQRVIT